MSRKARILWSTAALALVIAASAGWIVTSRRAAQDRQRLEEQYHQGLTAFEEKRYGVALSTLQALSEERPDDKELADVISQVRVEKAEHDEASLLKNLDQLTDDQLKEKAETLQKLKRVRPQNQEYAEEYEVAKKALLAWERKEREANEAKGYTVRIERELVGLEDFNVAECLDSKDSIIICAALFSRWATIAEEGAKLALTKSQRAKYDNFKKKVADTQAGAFPRLRDAYGPATRKELWEHDVSVRTLGNGYRVIEFTGSLFAANRNIKGFQEGASETLHGLRFGQARYKWYEGASEYTYFDMNRLGDRELVIWTAGGRYRKVD